MMPFVAWTIWWTKHLRLRSLRAILLAGRWAEANATLRPRGPQDDDALCSRPTRDLRDDARLRAALRIGGLLQIAAPRRPRGFPDRRAGTGRTRPCGRSW